MKKYIIFLLSFLTLTAVQCKKSTPEEQLPPITTTGANTFGCLVNGSVLLPYGGWNVNALTVNAFLSKSNSEIQIYASNRKNGALSDLDITLTGINDTGTYKIYDNLGDGLSYSDGAIDYNPYDTFGIVRILRCDTIQKIVSGTFSFIGYTNPNHTVAKTINITDGRFDVHYPITIH